MTGVRPRNLEPLESDIAGWTDSIAAAVRADNLREIVRALPAPRSRLHAPGAMTDAEALVMNALRDAGWATERRAFHWRAILGVLDYPVGDYPAGRKLTLYRDLAGANLFAVKDGADPRGAIVVGAHLDTVRDSPGADDNAASVAALIELARVLAPHRFRETLVFAVFDMEEIGLVGSQAAVPALTRDRRIEEAIIFETMAYTSAAPRSQTAPRGMGLLYPAQMRRIAARRFTGDWTMVIHRRDSTMLARSFAEGLARTAHPDAPLLFRDPADLPLVGRALGRLPLAREFSRGDHASFWSAGIPAITITDTGDYRNPNYHRPTDTADTLDWERLAAIVAATASALARRAGLIR